VRAIRAQRRGAEREALGRLAQRQAICAALDFAGRQLSLVASAASGEAAQIHEFQVALLEDEEPSSCFYFVVARLTV